MISSIIARVFFAKARNALLYIFTDLSLLRLIGETSMIFVLMSSLMFPFVLIILYVFRLTQTLAFPSFASILIVGLHVKVYCLFSHFFLFVLYGVIFESCCQIKFVWWRNFRTIRVEFTLKMLKISPNYCFVP